MSARRRAARRLLGLLLVGLPPWTVIKFTNLDGSVRYETYFTYGLGSALTPVTGHFVLITTYLSKVAMIGSYWHQAWPTASFLYACALASAALGLVDREDRRVTAGLLAMAGALSFMHAAGLAVTNGRLAVLPLGPLLCWNALALGYRDALVRVALMRP